MGYKIPDVKVNIHEEIEDYCLKWNSGGSLSSQEVEELKDDLCDIVDKHFEKIER